MPHFQGSDGRLFYRDEGQGPVLVIAHGTPTHSGEYAKLIESLKDRYRVLALDHLGFGASDKPVDADYSLAAHRRRFREWLTMLKIDACHLLVHDFGAVIALPAVLEPRPVVSGVILLNTWLWPLIETEPQMKSQARLLQWGVLPWLYRSFNFSPRVLLKMAWGRKNPLTRERHRHYMDQFPTARDREGAVGFMRALFDFGAPAWRNDDILKRLRELPVLIAWGLEDRLIGPRNLARWRSELPYARVMTFDQVGHFVAEENTAELSALLGEWLERKSP